jgi:AraC-like DNA-binding protein
MPREPKTAAARSKTLPQVLRHLRRRGADVDALLGRLGLPRQSENMEEVALAPADFEALLGAAATELHDPLLALGLPGALVWPSYSVGELAAHASPTLREAFERVVRYGALFYAHLIFSAEERGGELHLTHRLRGARKGGGRYGNEYATASVLGHARRLTGRALVPSAVWFSHAEPAEPGAASAIRGFFAGSELEFGRSDNGLSFTLEEGELPSVAHDPRLLRTAEQLADQALAELPAPAVDFVGAVRLELRRALPDGTAEAAAIARRMRLSTRTLQRRLEEAGTSWKAVLDGTRRDLATDELRGQKPLAEIAATLGFSDVAAFSRAYKRWTGRSPGAHQRELAAGETALILRTSLSATDRRRGPRSRTAPRDRNRT